MPRSDAAHPNIPGISLTMDLIKQLMADGHADQFWSPGPDYVTSQFFCPAIILERGATFSETSGEQRTILIKVDRRNGWLTHIQSYN